MEPYAAHLRLVPDRAERVEWYDGSMEPAFKPDPGHGGLRTVVALGAAFLVMMLTACAHGGGRTSRDAGEVTTESYVVFDEAVAVTEYSVEVLDPSGRRRFTCRAEASAADEEDDCATLHGIGGAGPWTFRYRVRHFDGRTVDHEETVTLTGDESHLRVRVRYVEGREGPYVRQWHTRHPRDISVVFRTEESGKPRMAILNATGQSLLLNWAVAHPPVVLVPSSRDPRSGDLMAGCGQMFHGPLERIDSGGESVLSFTHDDSPLPAGSYRLLVRGQLVDPDVTLEEFDSLAPVSVYAEVEFVFRVAEGGSPSGLSRSERERSGEVR
jgi:hypothetical protein